MKTLRIVRGKEAQIASPSFRIVTSKRIAPPVPDQVRDDHPKLPKVNKLMRFDGNVDISAPDSKSFDVVKDGDRIIDYQNVRIKGYLSTFKGTTESDRDGDYVEPGAFSDSLPRFRKNPVMLADHRNSVSTQVGSFPVIKEDKTGLYVEGLLSNANSDFMRQVRALVAEGHLKTMSMGGLFYYKDDGRGIFKVELYEGTLTPIPANPDALFSVRECTEVEMKMWQAVQSCET